MSLYLFAKNLRHIRFVRGLSQEQLGRKLNVVHQTIGHWERGICYPQKLDQLVELCDVLKIKSIDQFIRTDMTRDYKKKVMREKRRA
jgi:transcriptional regulator with XRE-family HTH domain